MIGKIAEVKPGDRFRLRFDAKYREAIKVKRDRKKITITDQEGNQYGYPVGTVVQIGGSGD